MEAQKARYLGVFTYADNGIVLAEMKNSDLLITEVNARALSLLGFEKDKLSGQTPVSTYTGDPVTHSCRGPDKEGMEAADHRNRSQPE